MDFEFSEEQRMLRESVRKMMAKSATPEYIRRLDHEQAFPDELYAEWVKMGLFRMPFPEEYGGLGGSVIDMVIIAEELSYKSFDLFSAFGSPIFCGLNVLRKGTEEQKRHWLPKLLSGEVKFSVSMSEPEAGCDIGAMRTSARRDGDGWVINGQKLWATGAGAKNNVINVYVKTDTKAHYRQGMSLFLVDNNAPGVQLRKLDMLGRRCTGTYEIFLNDVRVPHERLIGGENNGWQVVLSGLQVERITSTSGYIGGMQAILDLALQYAKDRKQFGRPIGSNQVIAHMLADMQTELEASRLMMWRAAWMLATGKDALKEISMAKVFASETYVKLANMGMQILGAYGYNMEFDMQRYFRDARSTTIGAGTSQMQRNLIAGLMGLKVQP
ncbi:MAG: acyl-CoA/acyl-ACP dehydrogenase [Betaproteobacteria bacterium]|nr:acyl-CoA/acyl-ACP dehydrogenase [Betaproteobacteria bacterium]